MAGCVTCVTKFRVLVRVYCLHVQRHRVWRVPLPEYLGP